MDDEAMSQVSNASRSSRLAELQQSRNSLTRAIQEEKENMRNKRQKRRETTPIPMVGTGCAMDFMNENMFQLNLARKVWHQREDLQKGSLHSASVGVPAPFGDDETFSWAFDQSKQLKFAERFHVPFHFHMDGVRQLGTDRGKLQESRVSYLRNHVSEVLFALDVTHTKTALSEALGSFMQEPVLPQWDSDVVSQKAMYGPEGGLCGTDETCFWDVRVGDGTQTVDPNFLRFTTLLLCGLANGYEHMWPGVNTEYTNLQINTHKKSVDGADYVYDNFSAGYGECPKCVLDDITPNLSDAILKHRRRTGCGLSLLAADRHSSTYTRKINNSKDTTTPVQISKLFRAMLHMDLLRCVDEKNVAQTIKVCVLRIFTKIPGVDTCVAIKSFLEHSHKKFPQVQHMFNSVTERMRTDLGWRALASGHELFDTNHSTNLARLTSNANVPLAVFQLAAREKLFNVALGGMRMDLGVGSDDRRIYNEYAETVYRNREEHFTIVQREAANDFQPGGLRNSIKPVEAFELHAHVAMHYRSLKRAELESMLQTWVDEGSNDGSMASREMRDGQRNSFWHKVLQTSHHSEDENEPDLVYFPVGGGYWQWGVLVELDLKACAPIADILHRKGDLMPTECIEQPARMCPMVSYFLKARAQDVDPFMGFEMKYIADLGFLKQHKHLPIHVTQVREKMLEPASLHVNISSLSAVVQDRHILQLYGKIENPVMRQLRQVETQGDITTLFDTWDSLVYAGIYETLELMSTGMLTHFAMAATSVLDLKRQGRLHVEAYTEEGLDLRGKLRELTDINATLASEDSMMAIWSEKLRQRLNLGVSWCNSHLQDGISRAATAFFCKQDACWGCTIWISDCGQSVQVLGETMINRQLQRDSQYYDAKAPGMGIDAVNDSLGLILNAYGRHLTDNSTLQTFYDSPQSRDMKTQWVSSLSMTTLCGCGVKKDASGHIDDDSRGFVAQAGSGVIFTEMFKVNSNGEGGSDPVATIESNLADSAKGEGMNQVPWQSTEKQRATTYEQLFNGIPLWVMCSNRFCKQQPVSMKEGGRAQYYNTSVMDGNIGVLFFEEGRVLNGPPDDMDVSDASDDENAAGGGRSASMGAGAGSLLRQTRAPIVAVSEKMAKKNRMYFLMRHLARKALPLLHRTMTAGFYDKTKVYSFSLVEKKLFSITNSLLERVRRVWLDESVDTAFRTFYGPYVSATATPVWVQTTLWRCMWRELAHTPAGMMGVNLDLVNVVSNSMKSIMTAPISAQAHLDAMYKWFLTSVLDVSCMVLTCFALTMLGLRSHCPLMVLAKAARGLEMTAAEEKQYNDLCEFLLPIVTHPRSVTMFSYHFPRVNTPSEPFLIPSRCLLEPDDELLKRWYEDSEIRVDHPEGHSREQTKNDGTARKKSPVSTYLRPNLAFVDNNAKWCETKEHGVNKKGPRRHADLFVTRDVQSMLAQGFATAQIPEAQKKRLAEKPDMPAHHDTSAFWLAAQAGTRLPMPKKVNKKQDKNMVNFDAVWETGHFYTDTMDNLKNANGPIRAFLYMCGLPHKYGSNCTRRDVLTAIMGPYMEEHGVEREFPDSKPWLEPILQKVKDDLECNETAMKFGSTPSTNGRGQPNGVDIALGIDILWFLVGQGLYCEEWTKNEKGHLTVVHLRNLGSAAKALLEMMMHVFIEKSAIPPSPIMLSSPKHTLADQSATECVRLNFCKELHVDSFVDNTALGRFSLLSPEHHLLSVQGGSENFQRVTTADGEEIYTYTDCGIGSDHAASIINVFPLPPEAISHMQHMMYMLTLGRCQFHKQFECTPHIPDVLRCLGGDALYKHVSHWPCNLTDVLTQEGAEVPCMILKTGSVFVLRMLKKHAQVMPLIVPSVWHKSKLPVEHRDHHFAWFGQTNFKIALDEIGHFMTNGLTTEGVHLTHFSMTYHRPFQARKNEIDGAQEQPATFLPVIGWEHLLKISTKQRLMKIVKNDSTVEVLLVEIAREYQEQEWLFLPQESKEQYMQSHAATFAKFANIQDQWSLDIFKIPMPYNELIEEKDADVRFWLTCTDTSNAARKAFYYFNTREEVARGIENIAGGLMPYTGLVPDGSQHFESVYLACDKKMRLWSDLPSLLLYPLVLSTEGKIVFQRKNGKVEHAVHNKSLETVSNAGSCADKDPDAVVALLCAWKDGSFLKNGHYKIMYKDGHRDMHQRINCMTALRMVVPEGSNVFIALTPTLLASLVKQTKRLRLSDANLHVRMLEAFDENSEDSDEPWAFVSAHYVLKANAGDVTLKSAFVRLIVRVEPGADSEKQSMENSFWVRVFSSDEMELLRFNLPAGTTDVHFSKRGVSRSQHDNYPALLRRVRAKAEQCALMGLGKGPGLFP